MKRNIGTSSACLPAPKKQKASVLHEVVRLLDEISVEEVAEILALISVKIQSLHTQEQHGYILPVKAEKEQSDHGYEIQFTSPLLKTETECKYVFGSRQFRQEFAEKIDELRAAALSAPDAEEEMKVSKKNNMHIDHPDYIALRVAQDELHAAKKRENAESVWQLQNTLFVGRFLFTEMKWRMEKIAFRFGTSWYPENDRIVSVVANSEAELFERLRRKALSQCRKLASRCGGMEVLQQGSDHCSQFFKFCSSSFKFTKEETDGMKELHKFSALPDMQI